MGWDVRDHKPNLSRYEVNLLIEHAQHSGAPIIDEPHPTYANLIGKIERKAHLGVVYTDFTEIRAGSCLARKRRFFDDECVRPAPSALLLGSAQAGH